jgi:hypothetical protein
MGACCLASKDLHHKTPLVQLVRVGRSHSDASTIDQHFSRLIQRFSLQLACPEFPRVHETLCVRSHPVDKDSPHVGC